MRSLVLAAQAGDRLALDELVTAYLPFVYTIVRRALGEHPDGDDVVQESMLRALRELPTLRNPESFRSWLAAIAVRQVGTYRARRYVVNRRTVALDHLTGTPDANADFEGVTLLRVELSDQRQAVVRAGRWLDPDDRALLSLWWLETAGQLTRTELAAALGMSLAHAGVRVQRMRSQLDLSRSLVAALDARPRCPQLVTVVADWDGVPDPLWRKRIARHTRSCAVCTRAADGLVAPERLLAGLGLLPVPAGLAATVIGNSALAGAAVGAASPSGLSGVAATAGSGVKAGIVGQLAQVLGAHPLVAAVAAGTLVAGAAATAVSWPPPQRPATAVIAAPTPGVASIPSSPLASTAARQAPKGAPTSASPSGAVTPQLPLGPVSLESVNEKGLVITTSDKLGTLQPVTAGSPAPQRQRATFQVVAGLADPRCVSFRTQDGEYLRHASWRMRTGPDEGSDLYHADATFCVRAGSTPGSVSLQSFNYPKNVVRHRGNELWLDPPDGTAAFPADASFVPRLPLAT